MNRLSQRTQYGGSPEGGQGGGYAGYWKIALYKRFSFNLFFSFFFFHNIVVLSSTYDVDFMIWFLKRWYFFQEKQKKNQAIMNVFFFFLSLENLRVCYIPMFFHLKFTLPIKYSILGFFMFYCFSTRIQLDLFTHIGM